MERSLLLQALFGPLLDSRAQNCVWNPSSGWKINKLLCVSSVLSGRGSSTPEGRGEADPWRPVSPAPCFWCGAGVGV